MQSSYQLGCLCSSYEFESHASSRRTRTVLRCLPCVYLCLSSFVLGFVRCQPPHAKKGDIKSLQPLSHPPRRSGQQHGSLAPRNVLAAWLSLVPTAAGRMAARLIGILHLAAFKIGKAFDACDERTKRGKACF